MYDYLVSAIECPHCRTAHEEGSASIKTHIRDDADGSKLKLGYCFSLAELETASLRDSGFLLIHDPRQAGQARLLETWTCHACNTEQWSAVDIEHGKLARISGVVLTKQKLESANFIEATAAEWLAASLLDIAPLDLTEQQLDPVEVLRQRLPD